MAQQVPVYGIDKEISEKIHKKYDSKLEDEIREWIEEKTGVHIDAGPENLQQALRDGTVLHKQVSLVATKTGIFTLNFLIDC